MATITFVITNSRHHHEMMWPVARELANRHTLRLISFCEFRGMNTPKKVWADLGAKVRCVPPINIRPRDFDVDRVVGASDTANAPRKLLYPWVWRVLKRLVGRVKSDVVVVPNDAAFPMNYFCADLRKRGTPFVLVQEGIRFPLGYDLGVAYGSGGAKAIACWGEGAVRFFKDQGVSPEVLFDTGSPRYDAVVAQDLKPEVMALRSDQKLPEKYLLFVSNPVDDQGLCSSKEKQQGFLRFCQAALPLVGDAQMKLLVRLHSGESREEVEKSIAGIQGDVLRHLEFSEAGSIHAVMAGAEAVMVWSSTAGLEALMQGKRLGVLQIPGGDYAFDYATSGVVRPIPLGEAMLEQLSQLLVGTELVGGDNTAEEYVRYHLNNLGSATRSVAGLVERMTTAESV